ncbi:MAG: FecR domain-containing protein [Acidobacteriota bacterium]|nr:FecR domain-containing protein [Acidobacteriota bacterium]
MEGKYRKFYVDFWRIKKRTIYSALAVLGLAATVGGGAYWLWKNNWVIQPPDSNSGPSNAARIVSFQGDVRIVRVSTRKTERVVKETYVVAGDTIQTQADGRAQVRMIDGSMLSIRPNSTVVIRDSKSLLGGTTVRVKLDDGQIRVKTEDQPKSTNNVVEIKQSENRIYGQTDASFNLNKKTDRGEIRITRGTVRSDVDGVSTTLRGNEYATIKNGRVTSKEELLDPPSLRNPSASMQVATSGSEQPVEFSWARPPKGSDFKYQLQVSKSPFFVDGRNEINENLITAITFKAAGLKPGTYFWRVRATADSGQTTEWSEPSRFTVVKTKRATSIQAGRWSVEHLGGSLYRISGITNPGATVRIANRETFARSDGSFLIQISSGSRNVGVEINDDEGNRGKYDLSLSTGKASR